MLTQFIDSVLFSYFYPLTLVISVIVGFVIARKFWIKKNREWKPSGIEGGVIGFYSLIISFTLVIAGNSMRERTQMVHQESDAVLQMIRDADLFDPAMHDSINWYLDWVLSAHLKFDSSESYDPATLIREVGERSDVFWNNIIPMAKQSEAQRKELDQLLPHFNQFCGTFYRFLYSYEERTPLLLILLLIVASYLIGLLVGFMNGFQQRHLLAPLIYVVLVSSTLQTIRDVDNPYRGTVKPNYENLRNIREEIRIIK